MMVVNSWMIFGHSVSVNSFNIEQNLWKLIEIRPNLPSLRDSHITFVHKDSFYIHGGSSASNIYYKGDFFEFNFITQKWASLKYYINDNSSNHIFCHSGAFVESNESIYIFGGYNGLTRLNDFKFFKLNDEDVNTSIKNQTFVKSMESYINNKKFSDTIIISSEGEKIYAHKILLSRIQYFENLFNSEFIENTQNEIHIDSITNKILLKVIKYIYTTTINIELEEAVQLYEAANYFGLDDLKRLCEDKILSIANIDNCCDLLLVNYINIES
jgi:hypothetical protein